MKVKRRYWIIGVVLFLLVGIFFMLEVYFKIMNSRHSGWEVPQGDYHYSTYDYWNKIEGIAVRLSINGKILDDSLQQKTFARLGRYQTSSGSNFDLRNGRNTIEVYFKAIPLRYWSEEVQTDFRAGPRFAQIVIGRTDMILKNGKFFDSDEFTEVFIKFELDKDEKPIITTPEGKLHVEDLEISKSPHGSTIVRGYFNIDKVIPKTWEKATVYNPKRDREALEEAYINFYKLLHDHSWLSLRELYADVYVEAVKMSPYTDQDMVYGFISPEDDARFSNIALLPLPDLHEFKEEIIADGQLVRLYKENSENHSKSSPIVYKNKDDGSQQSIMPYFSVVDGKIKLTAPY